MPGRFRSSRHWRESADSARSSSTPPSFGPTSTPLVPQKNGAQALGRSRGGLTTKIHVAVDGLGRLIQGRVSAGQVHDITQAGTLLDGVPAKCVVADKAYDAMALREQIAAIPAKAVIPPRANRRESIRWSKAIYKHRNLVERFFCRIKQFRRIATRYDKLAERFASFICLVGAIACST